MSTGIQHQTEQIWRNFSRQLKRFILSRVADASLADDILQDTFVKIHARLATLKDDTKLESWLYQIARNTIIDHYRGQKPALDLPEIEVKPDAPPQPSMHQEIASGLRELIEQLPEKYRQALLFTEIEGFSQKALADQLGISVSGAKSRVQRARQKIKDLLMECCHFEVDRYGTILDAYPVTCCRCARQCTG